MYVYKSSVYRYHIHTDTCANGCRSYPKEIFLPTRYMLCFFTVDVRGGETFVVAVNRNTCITNMNEYAYTYRDLLCAFDSSYIAAYKLFLLKLCICTEIKRYGVKVISSLAAGCKSDGQFKNAIQTVSC